jgi:hypothetical protein
VKSRIVLAFEHPTCDIGVDVHIAFPNPIQGAEALAARVCPACPICKEPMSYTGFWLGTADKEDPLRIESLP